MMGDAEPLLGDTATLMPPVNEEDHVLGLATAPIQLVEYGDYGPVCQAAWLVVDDLRRRLAVELRFAFRHFVPKGEHMKFVAAEAAEVAASRGKFWEMHDLLCRHAAVLSMRQIEEDLRAIGVDPDLFRQAVDKQSFADTIRRDTESAIASGVRVVPSFFINGILYRGPIDAGWLTQTIQQAVGP